MAVLNKPVYGNKRHTIFWKDKLFLFISNSHTHDSLLHQFVAGFCTLNTIICFPISSLSLLSSSSLAPFFWFRLPRSICLHMLQEKQYLKNKKSNTLSHKWEHKTGFNLYLVNKMIRKFKFKRRKQRIYEARSKEKGIFLECILSKYICILKLKNFCFYIFVYKN